MAMQIKRNGKKGFTLVEIMVVVALIGLIAVIAIPNYMRSRQNSARASFQQTLTQIAEKMEAIFWGQNPNEYPPLSAFPDTMRQWATPTNLGNIEDLLELLKKFCEQRGITQIPYSPGNNAGTTVNPEEASLLSAIDACFNSTTNRADYLVSDDGQDWMINTMNPYGGGFYSVGASSGSNVHYTPPAPPPAPPAPRCGDNNADTGEQCGEPGLSCPAGKVCNNDQCLCVTPPPACGNGILEPGEQCGEGMQVMCIPGYTCNYSTCHCEYYGGSCFLPGTQILMSDGNTKSIESVQTGDQVLSYDENTRENVPTRVTQTFRHEENAYLVVNGTLQVTPHHPVYVGEHWKAIGDAKVGDLLKRVDGSMYEIKSIEPVQKRVTVYNLEVDQTHTYYAEKTLVHNKGGGCFIGDTQILMANGTTKSIRDIEVGDMVSSYDEETKQVVASEVLKLLIHDPEIYWIVNGRIKVTPNHSFYMNGKWKQIGDTQLGDHMLTIDGKPEPITSFELITTKEPIYNLEIKKTHTYYAEGVLVHNQQKSLVRTPWGDGNQGEMFDN